MSANSVTNFTWQCRLSELCETIISSFYAIKAKIRPGTELQDSRNRLRERLHAWLNELPPKLMFTPWSSGGQPNVPIHVIVLQ